MSIVHYPKSLAFKGTESLSSAALGDVFAAASGSSIEGSSDWTVMSIRSPFDLPQASFLVYLDGADHSPIVSKNTYDLTGSGSLDSVRNALNRIDHSNLDDLSTGSGEIEKVTWTAMKPESRPEEKAFLHAFGSLYTLIEQIDSTADLPAFWTVRLPSSQSLVKSGSSIAALAEAKKIEAAAIDELVAAVKKVYGYDVLIAVAAVVDEKEDEINVRHKRQAAVFPDSQVQVSTLVSMVVCVFVNYFRRNY